MLCSVGSTGVTVAACGPKVHGAPNLLTGGLCSPIASPPMTWIRASDPDQIYLGGDALSESSCYYMKKYKLPFF